MLISFRKLQEDAVLPSRKRDTDSGIDIYAYGDYIIKAGSFKIVKTGVKGFYPKNTTIQIWPKSRNNYLIGGGVIDYTYTGEILVKIFNPTKEDIVIRHGRAIAQLVIVETVFPYISDWEIGFDLDTDRGNSGGIVTQLKGE